MASSPRTRGRLPARVYWFRRALVLGTVLALTFAVARLVTSGESENAAPTARSVAGIPTSTAAPTMDPSGGATSAPATSRASSTPAATVEAPPVIVEPDGPCLAEEVTIAPVEGSAVAGRAVPLVLQLSTTRPACTFAVSPRSVVAKVTSRQGKVWSSQDCPSAVASTSVILRSDAPTSLQVAWNGRGSDGSCSRTTSWALPGSYQVMAAAIGSEPSTAPLKLTAPPRPVVVTTIEPKKPKNSAQPKKPKQSSAPMTPNTGP